MYTVLGNTRCNSVDGTHLRNTPLLAIVEDNKFPFPCTNVLNLMYLYCIVVLTYTVYIDLNKPQFINRPLV